MKADGIEPTYSQVCTRCPNAVRNPETGEPVDKKIVYDIFRKECRDEGSDLPWELLPRLQKTALSEEKMAKRRAWGVYMINEVGHTEGWYFRHVIWIDLCHTVLPRTEEKAKQQALARKGKKGWGSRDCRSYSRNLTGNQSALAQASYGTEKVWWIPVLTRGKLHVELLPSDFPGETSDAVDQAVAKISLALSRRFPGDSKPRIVMSDRGPAFYHPSTGQITNGYRAALAAQGLRPMMGDDASKQAGDSQEVMLHETAIAWLRKRLSLSVPKRPWLESRDDYGARLKREAQAVNEKYNVDGLCRRFPSRMEKLVEEDGGRLRW